MTRQENAKTLSARKRIVQLVLTAELTAVTAASMDSSSTRPRENAQLTRDALLRIVTSVVTFRRRFVSSAPLASGLMPPRISALMPHAKSTNVMTVRFLAQQNATSASPVTLYLVKRNVRIVIAIQQRSSVRSALTSLHAQSVALVYVLTRANAKGVTKIVENVTPSPASATSVNQGTTLTKLIPLANHVKLHVKSAPAQTSAGNATKVCTYSSIQAMEFVGAMRLEDGSKTLEII